MTPSPARPPGLFKCNAGSALAFPAAPPSAQAGGAQAHNPPNRHRGGADNEGRAAPEGERVQRRGRGAPRAVAEVVTGGCRSGYRPTAEVVTGGCRSGYRRLQKWLPAVAEAVGTQVLTGTNRLPGRTRLGTRWGPLAAGDHTESIRRSIAGALHSASGGAAWVPAQCHLCTGLPPVLPPVPATKGVPRVHRAVSLCRTLGVTCSRLWGNRRTCTKGGEGGGGREVGEWPYTAGGGGGYPPYRWHNLPRERKGK